MRKWFIWTLWTLLLLAVLTVAGVFWAIADGRIGYMPDIAELQNPISRYASQVYSADGDKLIGTYSLSRENRVMVEYDDLPPHLVEALVATEDARFFEHAGIDFKALGRAIVKRGVMRQKSAGGGSTITQQLAKQLFSEVAHSTRERMLQKPIEWVIAVQLERNYTKEEIIAMYLNYFDFLNNAVGIKTAANTYFSREPDSLTITQAATLVGMCKNPSYFNPRRYPERCEERRNVVLQQMYKENYITSEELDSCTSVPLAADLKFHVADHNDGMATYFRDFLRRYMMAKEPKRSDYRDDEIQYIVDKRAWDEDPLYGWCNKNRKSDGTPYNIYTDGLKIYTTIDTRMQRYAEEACQQHVAGELQKVFNQGLKNRRHPPYSNSTPDATYRGQVNKAIRNSERYRVLREQGASQELIDRQFATPVHMTVFTYAGERDTTMSPRDSILYYQSFLRTGFLSMVPTTGHVKAYVGGLDIQHFAYDMCNKGRRQVGSTIKPFLYSNAFLNGYTPCSTVLCERHTCYTDDGRPWTPRNGSGARLGEMVTLRWGLQTSNNWISAILIDLVRPKNFYNLLTQPDPMGDNWYGFTIPKSYAGPSLCLGTCENTVAEMVSAYTTFVNGGVRMTPVYVRKIVDSEGKEYGPAQLTRRGSQVLDEETAAKMITMLQAVVDGGTGQRLRSKYGIRAEMGGKTGTTNDNSDGWFMGVTPNLVSGCWVGGENRHIHFESMAYAQGAASALPVYALYMKKVYADRSINITEDDKFKFPENFDPCHGELGDDDDDDNGEGFDNDAGEDAAGSPMEE